MNRWEITATFLGVVEISCNRIACQEWEVRVVGVKAGCLLARDFHFSCGLLLSGSGSPAGMQKGPVSGVLGGGFLGRRTGFLC